MGVRGWRGWRCTCEEQPLGNICLSCPQTDDYLQIFEMPTDTWAWSHVPFFLMGRYVRTNGNIIVCTSCHLQVAPLASLQQQQQSPLWFTQPKRNHSTSTEFSLDSVRTAQVCVRLEWWNRSQQRLTPAKAKKTTKKTKIELQRRRAKSYWGARSWEKCPSSPVLARTTVSTSSTKQLVSSPVNEQPFHLPECCPSWWKVNLHGEEERTALTGWSWLEIRISIVCWCEWRNCLGLKVRHYKIDCLPSMVRTCWFRFNLTTGCSWQGKNYAEHWKILCLSAKWKSESRAEETACTQSKGQAVSLVSPPC